MAKVRIKGEAELFAKLKHLPEAVAHARRRAIDAQLDETAWDVRDDVPVDTGDLRDSVQEERSKDGSSGKVVVTARHATFVLHGTSDTPAQDFMTPAIRRAEHQFPLRVKDEVRGELRRL